MWPGGRDVQEPCACELDSDSPPHLLTVPEEHTFIFQTTTWPKWWSQDCNAGLSTDPKLTSPRRLNSLASILLLRLRVLTDLERRDKAHRLPAPQHGSLYMTFRSGA